MLYLCVCVLSSFLASQMIGNYPYKYLSGPNFGVWFDEHGNISKYDDSGWLDRANFKDPIKHLYFEFDKQKRETNSYIYQRDRRAIYVYAEFSEETKTITVYNYAAGPKNKRPPTSTETDPAPPPPQRAKRTKRAPQRKTIRKKN